MRTKTQFDLHSKHKSNDNLKNCTWYLNEEIVDT